MKEKSKILNSLFYPILFIAVIWLVEIVQWLLNVRFVEYGLFPRTFEGLIGIVTSPFLHSGIKHLFNNSIPILVMGTALFYFYGKVAPRVVLWIVLLGGLWTWLSGRPSYHIGASGLVYGLFGFLLLSGFIRKHKALLSLSFLMAFIYGSLVWGILPIDEQISWEGHLWGLVAGLAMAYYYRKHGPQRVLPEWWDDDDDEIEENSEDDNPNVENGEIRITYHIKKDN